MIAEGREGTSQAPPYPREVRTHRDRSTIGLDRPEEVPLGLERIGHPSVQRAGIGGSHQGLLEPFDRLGIATQGLERIGQSGEGFGIGRHRPQGSPIARGRGLQPPRAVVLTGPLEPLPPRLSHGGPPLAPGDRRESPSQLHHRPRLRQREV